MKLFKLMGIFLPIFTTILYAGVGDALIAKAKKEGLKAIPTDKKELNRLIDPNGVITPARVELGKKLYFDPRLSKSGWISCNSCHNLGLGGVDGLSTAVGHKWTENPHALNSPTVYNAVFFKRQFWNGRSDSLEDQAKGPIQATPEMAISPELLFKRVNSIPEYVAEFKKAYGKKVKIDLKKVADTIAIFERILITPSRYDKFLHGDTKALSKTEQEGLEIFIDKGCVTCHNGYALGGELKPFELNKKYKFRDVGDFLETNKVVKVPTLRNITETAPYFHNGEIWDLRDAIKEMSNVQVAYKVNDTKQTGKFSIDISPISLTNKDIDKIMVFFKALEGEKPKIEYPQLPKSTTKTPKPNIN